MGSDRALTEVLESLKQESDGNELTMGEILEVLEDRGFGPLLLIPGLLNVLPTGTIPGVAAVCGLFIIFVAGQMLFGRTHPWLPERVRSFSVPRDKYAKVVDKLRPTTETIDRFLKPRLTFFSDGPGRYLVVLVILLLAIVMILLEVVPFMVLFPAVGISILALAMTAHDGLLALLGLAVALSFPVYWFGFR